MVLEFLRAEMKSTRFKDRFANDNHMIDLVESADLDSKPANRLRRQLLAYRGYDARIALFTGFPEDVHWWLADLLPEDLACLKYGRDERWVLLSHGSRMVVDGVRHLCEFAAAEIIDSIARRYAIGETLPRPIVVEHASEITILEGHARATAFVLAEVDRPLRVLLGRSPNLSTWVHL